MSAQRTFEDRPATRAAVPLLVGLVGPSGSGKTYSALRLATGIQRVMGGDIGGIDSEADRMLHYADGFKFRHLSFAPPFNPLSYLAAVEHFVKKGVKTIVIDSASHMHEGPGGMLEAHANEMNGDFKRSFIAWQKPKAELRKFLNAILQLRASLIFCFRAREKLKVIQGREPQPLGFMPIAGDEMFYEMGLSCLLYPNGGGVPQWQPTETGEKAIIKLPGQFREMFKDKKPLDEATGEALARWAAGSSATAAPLQAATSSVKPESAPGSSAPDRASAGSLEALSAQLTANGLTTKDERRKWLFDLTGMTAANLTEEACQRAIERAEEEAR